LNSGTYVLLHNRALLDDDDIVYLFPDYLIGNNLTV